MIILNSKLFFSTNKTHPAKIKTAEPKIDKMDRPKVIIESLICIESNFLAPVLNKIKILTNKKRTASKIQKNTKPRRTIKDPIRL